MHPLEENPFFILELSPTAAPLEVERQGKKLLAMLDLGLPAVQAYQTPLGHRKRTPELVRLAVQVLLEPRRRLVFEPWALAPSTTSTTSTTSSRQSSADGASAGTDIRPLLWWWS